MRYWLRKLFLQGQHRRDGVDFRPYTREQAAKDRDEESYSPTLLFNIYDQCSEQDQAHWHADGTEC